MALSPKISLLVVAMAIQFPAISSDPTAEKDSTKEDIVAPQTELVKTEAEGFIYGPATRVKFKIKEEDSGVEATYFKVSAFPYMQSDGRQMLPHDLEDGSHQLAFYSVDKEGNEEVVQTEMIYVDKKGPSITSTFNENPFMFKDGVPVFSSGVALSLSVKDQVVGVQRLKILINGETELSFYQQENIDLTEQLSVLEEGVVTMKITSYDTFYNMSKETIEFIIKK